MKGMILAAGLGTKTMDRSTSKSFGDSKWTILIAEKYYLPAKSGHF